MSLASANESLAQLFGSFGRQDKEESPLESAMSSEANNNKSFPFSPSSSPSSVHRPSNCLVLLEEDEEIMPATDDLLMTVENEGQREEDEEEEEEEMEMELDDGQRRMVPAEQHNGGGGGDGLDLSMLALQLLHQAQAQGLFGGGGGGQHQQKEESIKEEQEQSPPPDSSSGLPIGQSKSGTNSVVPDCPAASSPSIASSTTKTSKPSGHRRSGGSKSLLSAAAAAALMAPSPLGQVPSIPGAIAVAVSPAAQLFRDDDWSWHRNPAAAIRSGGTNKQTPVWKYFVYNKAENLSRCIVGNCTYQLKGPHTSTLACHLKKHTAEYAEFQRLKSDYTRERIEAGHGQAGRLDDHAPRSDCSTPCSGAGGFPGNAAPNGGGIGIRRSAHRNSRSPSATIGGAHHHLSPFPGGGPNGCGGGGSPAGCSPPSSMSCASPSSPPPAPIFFGQPPLAQPPPNGGIFDGGPGGCFPLGAAVHHFMMSAALAASQQQNGPPPPQHCRPNTLEVINGGDGGEGGDNMPNPPTMLAAPKTASPTLPTLLPHQMSGGTGANLLDILNLLTKRAAQCGQQQNHQQQQQEEEFVKKRRQEEEEKRKDPKVEEEEEEENDQLKKKKAEEMQRRWKGGSRKRAASGGDERDGLRRRSETEEEEESGHSGGSGGGGGGGLAHSVEHLLGGGMAAAEEKKSGGGDGGADGRSSRMGGMDATDRLALSLGTTLPRAALSRLLENPFMRGAAEWDGLTVERVGQILDKQFHMLREKMARALGEVKPAAGAMLAVELCCDRCWNVPTVDGKCGGREEGCRNGHPAQFWCTLSAVFPPEADGHLGGSDTLLLAVRKIDDPAALDEELAKIFACLELPECPPVTTSFLLVRPSHFAPSTALQLAGTVQKVHCLPAIFPDCLEPSFCQVLADDAQMCNLLDTFHGILEKFCANQCAQSEWKALNATAVTGDFHHSLLLGEVPPPREDPIGLLMAAEIVLKLREQFGAIYARHLHHPGIGALSKLEWNTLTELTRLFGHIRAKMSAGQRLRLGQISREVSKLQAKLQNDFPALGAFPSNLANHLATKFGQWQRMIGAEDALLLMDELPCRPLGLADVFGQRGGNWRDWASEEAEWVERSAMLLHNWPLLGGHSAGKEKGGQGTK